MKIIINREQLLIPLQQIVNVIEKRQTMPILSNVLINARENQIVLTGTDLEIQIVSKITLNVEQPGSITVPARKLLDLCRLLPNEAEIKIVHSDDKVKVTSGRSRFLLTTLPAENYPEFNETELVNEFFIEAGTLKNALDKTVFCMANQDVRYYLNGLLLHISNSKIKLVASDGHRLSFYEDMIGNSTGYETRIILPRKGVLELSRILVDTEAELKVQFSANNIKISYLNLVFSAKLIDAKYPDFSRVFDQSFRNPVMIQKHIMKDALTRVAVLSNEKFKGVTLDISENLLKISAHNPEHDEAEEELVMQYQDESMSISFNVQYLLDAISNLDSELAVLTIASNASCCFIEEPEQTLFKFIVMPMRL